MGVRQQRQAASKAASKQREMLMGPCGREEEQEEEDEAPFGRVRAAPCVSVVVVVCDLSLLQQFWMLSVKISPLN